ncbi:hypothetical protein NOG12_03205 [Pseudidiomarina sp. GXY010]|uniref:Uncharacterized protein n=1 Tax=Pseudidiomarina fusca TaxID=2965078 RepID=A0ABU3KW00_9GAMM|nr:hypothetical protein [Pseudidiomarina sp. GXY010]MDT7525103.1 hypothetical protein [Pseudidiomarina sp. GXY010]
MSTVQTISLVILVTGIAAFYALGIWGIKRMTRRKSTIKSSC